jgi:hypothetical protein
MQFSALGRLRVIRRIEGVGKEIRESWTGGGGMVKLGEVDIMEELRVRLDREGVWKTRTGQAVRERM